MASPTPIWPTALLSPSASLSEGRCTASSHWYLRRWRAPPTLFSYNKSLPQHSRPSYRRCSRRPLPSPPKAPPPFTPTHSSSVPSFSSSPSVLLGLLRGVQDAHHHLIFRFFLLLLAPFPFHPTSLFEFCLLPLLFLLLRPPRRRPLPSTPPPADNNQQTVLFPLYVGSELIWSAAGPLADSATMLTLEKAGLAPEEHFGKQRLWGAVRAPRRPGLVASLAVISEPHHPPIKKHHHLPPPPPY